MRDILSASYPSSSFSSLLKTEKLVPATYGVLAGTRLETKYTQNFQKVCIVKVRPVNASKAGQIFLWRSF